MSFASFRHEHLQNNGCPLYVRHRRHADAAAPVLVLLHGFPQTGHIWHRVVAALATRYSIICPDLRGYGASAKPPGEPDHANYSKRTMANDIVAVVDALGYERFHLIGHDRGARVAHRLALDHPARVVTMTVVDIAPTLTMYRQTDMAFAQSYFHWFFLTQPAPFPEMLMGSHALSVLHTFLGGWGAQGMAHYAPEALEDYERAWRDPATLHANCEDYRASASIDLEHDRHDEKDGATLACPVLVVWGSRGIIERLFKPVADWQEKCQHPVCGCRLEAGHFIPEEDPEGLLAALLPFLDEHGR